MSSSNMIHEFDESIIVQPSKDSQIKSEFSSFTEIDFNPDKVHNLNKQELENLIRKLKREKVDIFMIYKTADVKIKGTIRKFLFNAIVSGIFTGILLISIKEFALIFWPILFVSTAKFTENIEKIEKEDFDRLSDDVLNTKIIDLLREIPGYEEDVDKATYKKN